MSIICERTTLEKNHKYYLLIPLPHALFLKISAQERYRIRQGDCRIIYSIQDDQTTVHIYKIGHRREGVKL